MKEAMDYSAQAKRRAGMAVKKGQSSGVGS